MIERIFHVCAVSSNGYKTLTLDTALYTTKDPFDKKFLAETRKFLAVSFDPPVSPKTVSITSLTLIGQRKVPDENDDE